MMAPLGAEARGRSHSRPAPGQRPLWCSLLLAGSCQWRISLTAPVLTGSLTTAQAFSDLTPWNLPSPSSRPLQGQLHPSTEFSLQLLRWGRDLM